MTLSPHAALLLVLPLLASDVAGGTPDTPTRPIRWGIMGCGGISSDFVGALKGLSPEEGVVVACGARKLDDAKRFAESLGVERWHEGYESLANDPDVDVIYVGTVAQAHVACARIALAANKPVLVEKPLAMCASDAAALVREAKERNLFLMEGMWTRAFPAVRRARELIASGAIGDVVTVAADFGWPATALDGEHRRCIDPVSGGVSMDVAMYPIAHVLLATGAAKPTRIVATGTTKPAAVAAAAEVGGDDEGTPSKPAVVDWSVGAALSGFPGRPALSATLLCTLDASTPEEAVYTGTKGTLRIHRSAHTPTKLTLSTAVGRDLVDEVLDFPLPPIPPGARPFNYPGSQGFVYEARAVHAALREGRLEADEWTHEESVTTQAIIDEVRAAVIA